MMKSMIGCLFILIFGFLLIAIGILRMFYQLLTGGNKRSAGYGGTHTQWSGGFNNNRQTENTASEGTTAHTNDGSYSAGNAHHESANGNSRQRRSEKIFEKNEGEYIDFEEV